MTILQAVIGLVLGSLFYTAFIFYMFKDVKSIIPNDKDKKG